MRCAIHPAAAGSSLTAQRTDSGVEVSVSDTGEGIRAEDLPKVFDRFYRGEKSRSRTTGGSGLGLAISRGLVRAHGGDITVESTRAAAAALLSPCLKHPFALACRITE